MLHVIEQGQIQYKKSEKKLGLGGESEGIKKRFGIYYQKEDFIIGQKEDYNTPIIGAKGKLLPYLQTVWDVKRKKQNS